MDAFLRFIGWLIAAAFVCACVIWTLGLMGSIFVFSVRLIFAIFSFGLQLIWAIAPLLAIVLFVGWVIRRNSAKKDTLKGKG